MTEHDIHDEGAAIAPIELLVSRLSGVRWLGDDRCIACCPAHDDRHPSLGIRVVDDGTILLQCYAQQCPAGDITAAVGLSLADLFPRRVRRGGRGPLPRADRRVPQPSSVDLLAAIGGEALTVAVAASDIAAGRVIAADDYARVMRAAATLRRAADVAGRQG